MMAFLGETWIYLTFIGAITVPVVRASSCVNPFDKKIIPNTKDGKMDFENAINVIRDVLVKNKIQVSNLMKAVNVCTSDPGCSIEFKLSKKKYIELCVTPNSTQGYKTCVKRTCICAPSSTTTNGGLKVGGVDLVCNDEPFNYTSCEENNPEHLTSDQGITTTLDMYNLNDANDGLNQPTTIESMKGLFNGNSLWLTAGVFLGGVICGVIISTFVTHICCRRKAMKIHRSKTTTSATEEIPLYNSNTKETAVYAEIPENQTYNAHGGCDRSAEDAYSSMASDPAFAFVEGPCCPTLDFFYESPNHEQDIGHTSSPKTHQEYLEPLKRNEKPRNVQTLPAHTSSPKTHQQYLEPLKRNEIPQNVQTLPAKPMDECKTETPTTTSEMDENSDKNTYSHVYNHLQTNRGYQGQSQSFTKHYASAREMSEVTDSNQSLPMENTTDTAVGPDDSALGNVQESDLLNNKNDNSGQYFICVPNNSPVPDKETIEEAQDEVVIQNGAGNYFVLDKKFIT